MTPGITLLGLGPGDPHQLTREAWDHLSSIQEIYVRTRQHPTLPGFPDGLVVHSFDSIYESSAAFEDVYTEIVRTILELAAQPQGVTYAVPGSPFVAEATCPAIMRQAKAAGIPIRVIEGLSFIEPTCTALDIDPYPRLMAVDAMELAASHMPSFPPDVPALVAQVYSQRVAADVKLTLMAVYPDDHPVRLVHAAGTSQQVVEDVPLFEMDRSPHIGLLTSLYVPPLKSSTSFEAFQEIIAHLRAPDGCPWDREQDHQTLRKHLLEETFEAVEAMDADDPQAMCEELGDLLLQIVLHAQIGEEYGEFRMTDVLAGIHEKIVRRHPHVFCDVQVAGSLGVVQNWEKIKQAERAQENPDEAKGMLDGVPAALPALVQAQELQDRAARVGFDWPSIEPVWEKVMEELGEVRAATDLTSLEGELGDLLFALVNIIRWHKLDAEAVLRSANQKFRRRFAFIEKNARESRHELQSMTLEQMDELWEKAKLAGL